jgi:hypothetical protein
MVLRGCPAGRFLGMRTTNPRIPYKNALVHREVFESDDVCSYMVWHISLNIRQLRLLTVGQ